MTAREKVGLQAGDRAGNAPPSPSRRSACCASVPQWGTSASGPWDTPPHHPGRKAHHKCRFLTEASPSPPLLTPRHPAAPGPQRQHPSPAPNTHAPAPPPALSLLICSQVLLGLSRDRTSTRVCSMAAWRWGRSPRSPTRLPLGRKQTASGRPIQVWDLPAGPSPRAMVLTAPRDNAEETRARHTCKKRTLYPRGVSLTHASTGPHPGALESSSKGHFPE